MNGASGPRAALALAIVLCAPARPSPAQSGREALLLGNRAYGMADFDDAIALLSRGLDPSATPRDKLWLDGVQMLAYALLERNQATAAHAWLRWALRLEPGMTLDSVNFPPAVWVAFGRAQASVGVPPDTEIVQVIWQWSPTASGSSGGSLAVRSGGPPISARLEGAADLLPAGSPRPLAAGTYTVLASAEGFEPARISVEVLPGVATHLMFSLRQVPPGLLYVASQPWGAVYLDGERIGYTTVAAHTVSAGTHALRIERAGFARFDTTIFVNQQQRVRVGPVRLQARPR